MKTPHVATLTAVVAFLGVLPTASSAQPADKPKAPEEQQKSAQPPPAEAAAEPAPPPPPAALPAAPAVEPGLTAFVEKQSDALGRGCSLQAVYAVQDLRYLACGDAGVWIVQVRANATFALLSRQELQGFVKGFFAQSGHLWAEVMTLSARQVAPVPSGAEVTPLLSPSQPAPRPVTAPPPAAAPVAAGAVARDAERPPSDGTWDRAAQPGAQESQEPPVRRESTIAPPRVGEVWELSFMARPFIVLENLGGGLVGEATVGYRAEGPFHLLAAVKPFGIGAADEGSTAPAAGFVAANYDVHLFEIGLGLGAQTVHDPDFDLQSGSGISLVQHVRLGAIDGLSLTAISYVVLFHSEFTFSDINLKLQIPFSRRTWLVVGGGGGQIGVGYGEVGLRTLLMGDRDAGSFFLTAVLGGANLFEEDNCFDSADCGRDIDYAGPMVGIGGEWRQ